MTSICTGSGPSSVRPGYPESVILTADYIEGILPPQLQVLRPVWPYIRPVIVDTLSTFCAAEPPGWPDLSEAVFAAVLAGGEAGAALVTAGLLTQVARNAFWYLACECTSGATPAAPTPDPPPAVPVINPPQINPAPAAPCQTIASDLVMPVQSGATTGWHTGTAGITNTGPGAISLAKVDIIPQAALSYTIRYAATSTDNAGFIEFVAQWYTSSLTLISTALATSAVHPPQNGSTSFSLPANARYVAMYADTSGANPAVIDTHMAVEFSCAAANPLAPATPCCPPDPIMTGYLSQILNAVTLIQRQAAPFGYIAGASHTGLADNGSLSIADLIGVKIDITTLPDSYGRHEGDPIKYFNLGVLTWGTADGYRTSTFLEHDAQVIFPPLAGVYTLLGYSLAPGIVIDITELVREP